MANSVLDTGTTGSFSRGTLDSKVEEGELRERQSSSLLYMSKIGDLFDCPQKYYWVHHWWLTPKEVPIYLTFGALIHKAIYKTGEAQDLLAGVNEIALSPLKEDEKILATFLLQRFQEKYGALKVKRIIEQEEVRKLPLESGFYFSNWCVKPDRVVELENGEFWVLEYKTTSGYGAGTASYYHNSVATLSYFYIMEKFFPQVKGTKLIVLTKRGASKKEEERCIIEDIVLSDSDKKKAESFIKYAHMFAEHIEGGRFFYKFQTRCQTPFGGACEYLPLCFGRKSDAYFKEVVELLFNIKDPDGHLFSMED